MSSFERDYVPRTFNSKDREILAMLQTGPLSTYKLHKGLTKQLGQKIAYKNVHSKIQRLAALKLVENVEGNFERGAIPYRLTDVGWFHVALHERINLGNVLSRTTDKDWFIPELFRKLLSTFFEAKTLRVAGHNEWLVQVMEEYLVTSCRMILNAIEEVKQVKGSNSQIEKEEKQAYIKTISESLYTDCRRRGENMIFDLFRFYLLFGDKPLPEFAPKLAAKLPRTIMNIDFIPLSQILVSDAKCMKIVVQLQERLNTSIEMIQVKALTKSGLRQF